MSAVELDLDAIRARVDAATEGPWTADALAGDLDAPSGYRVAEVLAWSDPDAEFIAHARTDVPALLAEVERLRDMLHDAERLDVELREARTALADTVPAARLAEAEAKVARVEALIEMGSVFLKRDTKIKRVQEDRRRDLGAIITTSMVTVDDVRAALTGADL